MKVTVEDKKEVATVGFGDVVQLETNMGKRHYLLVNNYNSEREHHELLLVNIESGAIWSGGIGLTRKELRSLLNRRYSLANLSHATENSDCIPHIVSAEVTIKEK